MNAQRLPSKEPGPVESPRQRVLEYLAARGGSVESAEGRGLTREMAHAVGYDDLGGLNALLTRLEREGLVTRQVRGRRTYRIALADPRRGGRGRDQGRSAGSATAGDRFLEVQEELRHPRGQLRACLLLLLEEQPSHGYDLVERLKPFGYERDDPAQTYRALRWLEDAGMIEPTWETPGAGPARRVYHLTGPGQRAAAVCAETLRERAWVLERHLGAEGGSRLRVVSEPPRSFEVLLEAKLEVHAGDETSAREVAERALGENERIGEHVKATGQVWVYDVTETPEH